MDIHQEIDTRGLNCPAHPQGQKSPGRHGQRPAAQGAGYRQRLTARLQAFAKQTGNELVGQQTVGEEYVHVLRRR